MVQRCKRERNEGLLKGWTGMKLLNVRSDITGWMYEAYLCSDVFYPFCNESSFWQHSINVTCFFQVKRVQFCRSFVKELVILFHRISAAPRGHVASIIKKELHWRFFHFLPLPPLLATGPFVAALDGKRIWYLPPARTQERRTHVLS